MGSGYTLPAELVQRLRPVRSVGAITGAGISKESGIPTYRGAGGVYDDPGEGQRTVEALSGHTLRADPDRTWRAIARLAEPARGAQPNAGHRALVAIEAAVERFALLTQNVDGLHRLAGSRNVIDIHGTVSSASCMRCGARQQLALLHELTAAPRCERCDGVLRPDAVLFGEMLDEDKLRRMHEAFVGHVPDLLLVVGTSAAFPYIAEPVVAAQRAGRLTVEVNPEQTELSRLVSFALRGTAGVVLPAIAAALAARGG